MTRKTILRLSSLEWNLPYAIQWLFFYRILLLCYDYIIVSSKHPTYRLVLEMKVDSSGLFSRTFDSQSDLNSDWILDRLLYILKTNNSIMFNDCRVYGSAMLFIMINIVYIGVKYVNYSANVSSIIASMRSV